MGLTRLGARRIFAVGLMLVSLAACSAVPVDDPGEAVGGTPATATEYVTTWFSRVTTSAPDLGWTLIDPRNRDLFGGEAAYREAIAADDWRGLGVELGSVALSDGEYRVHVDITVRDGGQLPTFFERFGFIQGLPTPTGYAGDIVVRLGTVFEPSGIQAVGGG